MFITDNSGSLEHHNVRYEVIADKDGFAYFPIINPGVDWGAGIAAVAEYAEDLDDNIAMNEVARADRIGANGGKPLEFKTVKAVSLKMLLAETGRVDLMHCDIQGAEKTCCIGTHGRAIETELLKCLRENGCNLECMFACDERVEQSLKRIYRDGAFALSNPRLFGLQ